MIYEYVIKGEGQGVFGEHGMMFPDGRYFIVDTHSSDMFVHLYQRKLITKKKWINITNGYEWKLRIDTENSLIWTSSTIGGGPY